MDKKSDNKSTKPRRWRRLLLGLGVTLVLLVATLIVLIQLAAPIIEKNHSRIETWVSREIGHQVRFEHIQLRWSATSPVIVLKDFAVKAEPDAQHWMKVKRMQFAIDWWRSLVKRELRLGKWNARGVELNLRHLKLGGQQQDIQSLFVTVDKWLGKNPVSIRSLNIHTLDANNQPIDIAIEEINLVKQKGTISHIEKPILRPWLKSQDSEQEKKKTHKQLRIYGKAYLLNERHRKVRFIIESSPYTNNVMLANAKIYLDVENIPFKLLPETGDPIRHWLLDNELTGQVWMDIHDGKLAAVQTTFKSTPAVNKKPEHHHQLTIAAHLYARKDAEKGWWITADRVELKTPKQKSIQGKFAVQYRDVGSADIDWLIRVPQFSFTQGNANITGQMQWHQPFSDNDSADSAKQQPYIKIQAQAKDFSLQQILPIIPKQAVYPSLYEWLRHAPKAGKLKQATIDIEGGLDDIRQGAATAKINGSGEVENVKLKYHKKWPSLTAEYLSFNLKQNQLNFTATNPQTEQSKIDNLAIAIQPLFDPNKVKLTIDVNSKIDMQKVSKFIQKSPLANTVGKRIQAIKLAGPGKLDLQVEIPLQHHKIQAGTTVNGKLKFDNAGLQLKQWPIVINRLSGDLVFTEKALNAPRLTGQLWGENINLELSTNKTTKDNQTKVSATTTFSLPTLAKEFKFVDKLPMLGSAESQIDIEIPENVNDAIKLQVRSDLKGVHIALPAPLGKTTSQAKPTLVKALLKPDGANNFRIEYANKQVIMDVNLISAHASDWEFNFNSPEVLGKAKLSLLPNQQILRGNFKKLYIRQKQQPKSQDTLDPSILPALNITVEDFQLDKKRLGKLTLITKPKNQGQEITKLQTQSHDFGIQAKGEWTVKNQRHQTLLNGQFTSKNFKRASRALDFTPSIESNKTRIDFSLNWLGAPYEFSMAKLNGSAYFKMSNGRVINVSKQTSQMIGIGRMLNMLSISSIPKRLRLNFSDLTETGLHFDDFKGKVLILNGNATTNDAQLDGSVSRIRWKGRVGLNARDYDLIMRVEPHMMSSLPVVAAIAGGPVVGPVAGVATWMMNKVIAPDLERMSSYTYEIKGPWADPLVRSIDPSRKSHRAPVVDKT